MRKGNNWFIYLIGVCLLLSVSCSKISQFMQKDYSGNYILGGDTLITIQQNPDKSVWINFYGSYSTQVNVKGNRIGYAMGVDTVALIIEKDGKTLSLEHNGKYESNIGEKIEDADLWNAFQSFAKNNFAEAETRFRKYLQTHPGDLWVELTLTNTLIQLNKVAEAKTELAKYEHNPESESNPAVKAALSIIQYTLTGKEKSAAGQNAWDGYEEVLNIAVAAPQVPQNITQGIQKIFTTQKPLGPEERNIIQQYIAPNMDAIQKFLTLPEKPECYVTSASQPAATLVTHFLRAQSLARSVVLYGRLQAEEGKVKESAEAYHRVIRFGQQLANGPVIPQLIGIAMRSIGEGGFGFLFNEEKITLQEDAQFVYDTLKELRKQEPLATQESILQFATEQANINQMLTRAHTSETKLILLETAATAKLYQLKEGKTPQTLQELVPTYLPEVPMDTFAKNPIIYQPSSNHPVYSYGPDTTDDGGQIMYDPTNGTISKGDLVFP